jgi:large subunit ribosomal protein L22
MSATAKLRRLRIAPRKVRLVADLIRGKSVEEAQTILQFTIKRAAPSLLKLLNSAATSAKQKNSDPAYLYISKITVDEGPKFKRWRARARGQTSEIQKKTSHVTLVLSERGKSEARNPKSKTNPKSKIKKS